MNEPFVRGVQLLPVDGDGERTGYPWDLAAVRALEDGLTLHPKVTYLIGENGSGKSTLLEAIAVAAGMNPEGGSSNFAFSTRESHSTLTDAIRLIRGARRQRTDFFLRAESLFTAATYLEQLPCPEKALRSYGGRSLHEQSHGESFLAVLLNRLGPEGLYVMDEPEAALSVQNCMTFLQRVHDLVNDGCQFVIATHSPIVLAYPDATIYHCSHDELLEVQYDESDPVRLTKASWAIASASCTSCSTSKRAESTASDPPGIGFPTNKWRQGLRHPSKWGTGRDWPRARVWRRLKRLM